MNMEVLKTTIENLDKNSQLDILNIFVETGVTINENNHGVMINLSCLNENIIGKIQKYISYVKDQEKELLEMEKKKKEAKLILEEFTPVNEIPIKNNENENKEQIITMDNYM